MAHEDKWRVFCPKGECKQARMPRYKSEKAWRKHIEHCDGVYKPPQVMAIKPKAGVKARNVCFDWQKGSCRRGARCRFAHCEPEEVGHSFNHKDVTSSEFALASRAPHDGGDDGCTSSVPLGQLLATIPAQTAILDASLKGFEFRKVQLGVRNGSSRPPVKKTRGEAASTLGEGATVNLELPVVGEEPVRLHRQVLDALRTEFSRCHPGVEFVSHQPDILLQFNMASGSFDKPVITSVFVYGRYNKFERGIPQSRWPCASCRKRGGEVVGTKATGGRRKVRDDDVGAVTPDDVKVGCTIPCQSCKGTGLQFSTSVQDLLGTRIVAAFEANDCVFHGMGREDIDVRCLGGGRPFVMELKRPRRRRANMTSPEFDALKNEINTEAAGRAAVNGPLRFSSRKEPVRLKSAKAEKSYTIRFAVPNKELRDGVREKILSLKKVTLDQRTPRRVMKRRADIVRKRRILDIDVNAIDDVTDGVEIELNLRAESGTYIKEFIHGDEGRTVPSVAEVLGTTCEVKWLDVSNIHAE